MSKKSLDHRPKDGEMLKPKELIELRGAGPLTLQDRRVFNSLVANAWGKRLGEPEASFVIETAKLRGETDANDELGKSLERLMKTIVVAKTVSGSVIRTPLLSTNELDISANSGKLTYQFTTALAHLIKDSMIFAKLDLQVARSFHSKYGFSLYEAISRRIRLNYSSEEFTIDGIRNLLGVDEGKLLPFKNLNTYAIRPALKEINENSPYSVSLEPRKEGRKVVALVMKWKISVSNKHTMSQ